MTDRRSNMELNDKLAEELENRGQWHRAARRWLVVLDNTMGDKAREAIARRREHCISMASSIPPDGRRAETKRRYKLQSRYNDGY
ncbi:PerC family transcriptional regulator [Enterobacter sp. DTU_2021_1002640_1_SI_PRY_ASU_LCPMC_013]|uniref:PerC family transcriptional regulator n=1 Tax=Enterobacter sp. DTU_2021_1002640_1_SI_PRY_ASU_LCPMC_013 TaxID=3077940 RepID=UPI0028E61248|nr:PerC family transcriptional regulator [Enterobacter sp. DTU_2021_1002640_1_SI_PRY_ASU_LCPMC_013]WNU99107.1 PerC family transcriptional regulator [Enterobacter sp. DTU_2021_1002640_1_SI_PRY_ASU_LCPMC_013]